MLKGTINGALCLVSAAAINVQRSDVAGPHTRTLSMKISNQKYKLY